MVFFVFLSFRHAISLFVIHFCFSQKKRFPKFICRLSKNELSRRATPDILPLPALLFLLLFVLLLEACNSGCYRALYCNCSSKDTPPDHNKFGHVISSLTKRLLLAISCSTLHFTRWTLESERTKHSNLEKNGNSMTMQNCLDIYLKPAQGSSPCPPQCVVEKRLGL